MAITEKDIISLIKAGQKDKLDPSVRQKLDKWIREAENDRIGLEEFMKYIKDLNDLSIISQVDSDKAWKKIHGSINKRRRLSTNYILRIAASVAILFTLSITILLLTNKTDNQSPVNISFSDIAMPGEYKAVLELANGEKHSISMNDPQVIEDQSGAIILKDSSDQLNYTMNRGKKVEDVINRLYVPRGGVYAIILADGTKAWLNSDSELTYPVVFNDDSRTVQLKGEAYFEVVEDTERPFMVRTATSSIRVLGTSFNVSAYENQEFISTTLVKGSVNITSESEETVILYPGQQSIIDRRTNRISVEEVNSANYISWVNGLFEFENMSLESIVSQLERWYDVEIEFLEPDLRDLHFTGAAERDKSIEIIMEMISKTSRVKFSIIDDHIVIDTE